MKIKLRALSPEEQATVKVVAGVGLLIFWGTTGFTPDKAIVAIVAGLLGIDTIRSFAKGSSSKNESTRISKENGRSQSLPVDDGMDSSSRRSIWRPNWNQSLRRRSSRINNQETVRPVCS